MAINERLLKQWNEEAMKKQAAHIARTIRLAKWRVNGILGTLRLAYNSLSNARGILTYPPYGFKSEADHDTIHAKINTVLKELAELDLMIKSIHFTKTSSAPPLDRAPPPR